MNVSNVQLPTQPQISLGDGYLQFKLNQNTTAILLVKFTQEVIVVPNDSITAIANTSDLLVGLMNWRNRIIWVVDLPRMFGLDLPIYRMGQCNIIVINYQGETIGLMVPEIKGTVRFNSDNIQSISNQISPVLSSYVKGCIWRKDELNMVLNIQAILKSVLLKNK